MDLVMVMKIVSIVVVVLLFLWSAHKTTKSFRGMQAFMYIIAEVIIFVALAFAAQWSVAQAFIKVELTRFHNTPIPSSEKLAVKGCVKNIGSYKASEVVLHVKVINNAAKGMKKTKDDGRPQTLSFSTVVARNLAKGVTKCFNKSFPYPPYFRLAHIRRYLSAN